MVLQSTGNGCDLANSLAGVSGGDARQDNTTAGAGDQSTGTSTDIAINGTGFMVVNTNATAGIRHLSGHPRRVVPPGLPAATWSMPAGYYLQGLPLDANWATSIGGNTGSTLDSLSTVNVANHVRHRQPDRPRSARSRPTCPAPRRPMPPASSRMTSTVDYYDSLGNSLRR